MIKNCLAVFNVLACAIPCTMAAAEFQGRWRFNLIRGGEEFAPAYIEFKLDGDKLSGKLNELKVEGSVAGESLKFTLVRPDGTPWGTLSGKVDGDVARGTLGTKDGNEMDWIARRAKPVVKDNPQTHTFEPKEFHRVFSGAIAPALRIKPGDAVRTWTVDAGGTDSRGKTRSAGGNPETGPFYIEGAGPGDTLVVKLNRIRLNRDTAGSGGRIVPDALGAGYFRDAKFDDNFSAKWKLDRNGGFATLAKPTEKLRNFRLEMHPMLGCIAVATPDKQTFGAGWLGSWGGNMDYNGMREGTTLYLPVYQEGALLFVGDGHAAQGDGELTRDALETSMDVEFTVDLIQGARTSGPRAENDEFIMAMGIANSLPEALKAATTQLARWIERDYGLTPNESAIVLGTSIRYDIAEIVDPQVHIVAKLNKKVLGQLAK